MADDEDRRFDDLRDLAQGAEVACERIRQSVGIIARIYEAGEDSDRTGALVSRRAVTLALAELAGEIHELSPREAAIAIQLLQDENARAHGAVDGGDHKARWLRALDAALDDQQSDLAGKVRLFGLMKARHDAR
jgi:hypothetical protein